MDLSERQGLYFHTLPSTRFKVKCIYVCKYFEQLNRILILNRTFNHLKKDITCFIMGNLESSDCGAWSVLLVRI